jgi:glycosyltransferase involved in cell wall biosynthesis
MAWWRSVKGEPAPPDWDRYREAVRDGLRNADHVLAPTRAMLRELQHDYGPLERADVIYHGRQLHYSNTPAVRLPAKEAMVFSTGRAWDQAKNLESLAAAANQLPWKVAVAGDAADSGEHTRSMDNVYWLGELSSEELLPWFARASIYALPARYEPFGLPVVEAGLSRCALVLGNIASLREIWGDAALFVDPDDPEALRRSIEKLIEDEDLRRDLGSRAHVRALELSPANMAAGYLAVYSELIRNRQPEPELICVS